MYISGALDAAFNEAERKADAMKDDFVSVEHLFLGLLDTAKEVYAKYVPLYEKAFAEAKAMKVPENMESRKKELVEEQEERFEMLKEEIRKFEAEKNTPKKESADGEDEEDEEDDEEE